MSKRGFPVFFKNAIRSNFVFYVFQFNFLNQWSEGTESVFESVPMLSPIRKLFSASILTKKVARILAFSLVK